MKLLLPRVACPHSTSEATISPPKPCPCALSLSQRPSSGETESASSNEAMPRHSLLSSRRMTKENLFGSGACTLFSHRVTYSLHDGGSHGMNLAMAGVMHPKISGASTIWNWLSCNLGDWMTIMVSGYQRRIRRELIADEIRRLRSQPDCECNGDLSPTTNQALVSGWPTIHERVDCWITKAFTRLINEELTESGHARPTKHDHN